MKRRYTLPILLLAFLVLAASIVATGYVVYRGQEGHCLREEREEISAVANLKVSELSMWRQERLADAGVFHSNGAFSALVRRASDRPLDQASQEELRSWIGRIQASYHYDQVSLLDAEYHEWMSVPEATSPHSSRTLQEAREAIRTGQVTSADFYPDEATKRVHFRVFVPIFDGPAGGRPLGVLRFRIDPADYLETFLQSWPTSSDTAETLLVRREADEVVYLNRLKYRENAPFAMRMSLDETNLPAVRAARGEEGIVEGVDYRGVPVLAALRAVPDSPWFLVAKMDLAEVYEPMRKWAWLMVLFLGILLFATVAAAGFLWRQRHATLFRQKYEAEAKYRNLFESSCDALMILEPPSWKFALCNAATVEMFRLKSAGEFVAYQPWELSPERQADGLASDAKARDMIATALREGMHTFEWLFKRVGGEDFPAVVTLNRVEQAGKVFLQATVRDITEPKRMENGLRASEARMRAITDSAQDAILMMDPQGLISYWNPAAESILGYHPEEAIGKNLHELLAPQRYLESHRTALPEFSRTGQGSAVGKTLELKARRKDGHEISVAMSLSAVSLDNEWHAVGILRDVTEKKRAEGELIQAKAELQEYAATLEYSNQTLEEFGHRAEEATRAKSHFLANMSHEIRTPMTAILGYVDILLEEHARDPMCEHLKIIKRNGEHLLGVINDILDLSKVESGKLHIERVRCSPLELVDEVVSLMRVRADAKQLKLQTDLAGVLPETIVTDPLRLRQVLVNLVGNAIKFTDQGEVRIAIRLTEENDSPRLRFDVTDTGIGIDEEHLKTVFRPFTQVDNSSARKFGGTGLGLCISKHLTEVLGGKIEVHSTPGKGSTFSMTIDPGPLNLIRMIQNTQESVSDRPATTTAVIPEKIELKGRVLLAEDGPDNQRLIAFLLKKAGAEVTVAENGQIACDEALAAHARGEPFDVILMDMQMPVMDGYEATRQLREQGYTGPIVALTAHAMAEDRQKCLDAGCDTYLTKPIVKERFLSTIAGYLKHDTVASETAATAGEAIP